jgi:hypothetical protein
VARVVSQEAEVDRAIGVTIKDLLSIVSALGDMVREAGDDDAWRARHTSIGRRKAALLSRKRGQWSLTPFKRPRSLVALFWEESLVAVDYGGLGGVHAAARDPNSEVVEQRVSNGCDDER